MSKLLKESVTEVLQCVFVIAAEIVCINENLLKFSYRKWKNIFFLL